MNGSVEAASDLNEHMLKYTYVTGEYGIWAQIESVEMLGRAQPVDKVYGAMVIFLVESEVEVVDDTGAKVFLAMDLSRFEGHINLFGNVRFRAVGTLMQNVG